MAKTHGSIRAAGVVLLAMALGCPGSMAWARLSEDLNLGAETPLFSLAIIRRVDNGMPVCQFGVEGRTDLVPLKFGVAPAAGDLKLADGLPVCDSNQVEFLGQVARDSVPAVRSAALAPTVGVLAFTCAVGFLAGLDASKAIEDRFWGPRGLRKRMLKENGAVGGLAGALASGLVVWGHEYLSGYEFYSTLSVGGGAGMGLVCGVIGGVGNFVVEYYSRSHANQY